MIENGWDLLLLRCFYEVGAKPDHLWFHRFIHFAKFNADNWKFKVYLSMVVSESHIF